MEDMGFLGNKSTLVVEQCCAAMHAQVSRFADRGQIGNLLRPHMLSRKISSEIARG